MDSLMLEAMRLTRAGKPAEATAMLQSLLSGGTPQRSLGDTGPIDLNASRITLKSKAPSAGEQATDARAPASTGRFEERSHSGPSGKLTYKLYLPANVASGMPLVVMLHGCTQSPDDFAKGTGMNRLADELGFIVAYPLQPQSANAQKCWNWFKPDHQQRDRGEPVLIAGMTRAIIAEHAADPTRVYVAGLSAGGAAAAVMAACYPELYAAVGVHSGLACGAARDLPSALSAMKQGRAPNARATRQGQFVPAITFHGDRDATVNKVNSQQIADAAVASSGLSLEHMSETGRTAAGRRFTRELWTAPDGAVPIEQWTIHDGGHAWSGGDALGSYTDPAGPDASREMMRFFLSHRRV